MAEIYRLHYRAQLKKEYSAEDEKIFRAVEECKVNIRAAQKDGRLLTAALYYADKMLFLYYEAVGEAVKVWEPVTLQPPVKKAWTLQTAPADRERSKENRDMTSDVINGEKACAGEEIVESGEDVQADILYPMDFLKPLSPYLQVWPGQQGDRFFVHMYHIYFHSVPKSTEDWQRASVPEKRRGRIAFLRNDRLFSYTYFHKAIVDEGLLQGDRYQSIALHENILFSYFEEPKTMTNIRNCPEKESKVIEEWLAVNPEAHFIHMPEGRGENFMFLPALFALGREDKG